MVDYKALDIWIEEVIGIWKTENINLEKGCSIISMTECEILVGINFPTTFKELYKKVNGFKDYHSNKYLFSIWSVERIIEEYKKGGNSSIVNFCDFLLDSHYLGFIKGQDGIYKNYSHKFSADTEKVADSFEEVIIMINSDSDLIN